MKVLVIGNGGREHALVWKIAQSSRVDKIYCAPGNPGTAQFAESVDIPATDIKELYYFARSNKIGLTIVGPEAPLVTGIVDRFDEGGLKIFGPTSRAAQLEGSKVFCKDLLRKYGIPTATFQSFRDPESAKKYIREIGERVVVKADGLAAGKGVIVAANEDEAAAAVDSIMVKKEFGGAGDRVVIEEFLVGQEVSLLTLTDGAAIAPLAAAQDHKAVFDGDTGPNTGGMGAYSPAPILTEEIMQEVVERILVPTVHAMNKAERPFKGVLYAGLMITPQGPRVLEYNVRFGDPETQPILMRLDADIVELFEAVVDGKLEEKGDLLKWKPEAAVCVVMASGGYPGLYEKGKPITGIAEAETDPQVKVFHAGTAMEGSTLVSSGGRVLGVTALGTDIAAAIDRAYTAAGKIAFPGAHYRKDIGAKALARAR